MKILFIILNLLNTIPAATYSEYCSKETVDSVYSASLAEAKKEYDTDTDAATLYLMSDWAYGESMLDLSEHLIQAALGHKISDQVLKADCLSMASAVSRLRGNLANAIRYAEECLELDRESGNSENISSSLNNIAGLYLTYGEAESARKYIDEAIKIEEELDRNAYLAIRYGVASEIYLKVNEIEKALDFAEKALELDSLDNRQQKVAVRRSQKAAVLMAMKRYPEAEKELTQALPVFIGSKALNSLAITYAQLGEIHAINGKTSAAETAFSESIRISQSIHHIYMESRSCNGLYNLYKSTDPAKALKYLERYSALQSELHESEATKMMQSFNVRYETLEKEQTIAEQESKIRWRNVSTIFLCLLLLFVCSLLYMNIRTAKAVEKKNAVLVKANLDKDRLLELARANAHNELTPKIISIAEDKEDMPEIKLTKRERQIAELCAKGKLNKEIASELEISQRTVETHKNNLFRKLGINNTVELMLYMQMKNKK
jgi:ATP/maltotriose-dependent transcriptional regulator MalT